MDRIFQEGKSFPNEKHLPSNGKKEDVTMNITITGAPNVMIQKC